MSPLPQLPLHQSTGASTKTCLTARTLNYSPVLPVLLTLARPFFSLPPTHSRHIRMPLVLLLTCVSSSREFIHILCLIFSFCSATGLLSITQAQFENLQSLFFTIGTSWGMKGEKKNYKLNLRVGGTTFEFTSDAQIWPTSLNSTIGGEEGKIYLVASDLGTPSGQGLDFISA